jgi:hypothetical protein
MVSYDVLIFYEFNSKTHLLTTRCDGCIRCCNKTITGDMQIGSRTNLWHKCKWLVSDGFVFSISATAILTSNSFWWDGPHGHTAAAPVWGAALALGALSAEADSPCLDSSASLLLASTSPGSCPPVATKVWLRCTRTVRWLGGWWQSAVVGGWWQSAVSLKLFLISFSIARWIFAR